MGLQTAAAVGIDSEVDRVERTVALVERRGYALPPRRLGRVCLGGEMAEDRVLAAVATSPALSLRAGLVVMGLAERAPAVAARGGGHRAAAEGYMEMTRRFTAHLVALCPFVLAVSVAGSLASDGFSPADDVDLNLIVADGRRHLAYVALNLLGLLHALGHRGRPADEHTRRPLAPRLMTANLILEVSQCFPLARQDEDMAYEILSSVPLHGAELTERVIRRNPGLAESFPQLAHRAVPAPVPARRRLPGWAFPAWLDLPSRLLGRAGWRYMQWCRRRHPEALARVALVRRTMRPYTLFDGGASEW